MNRREFLRTAGGATGAAAALGASGTATAQENGTAGDGGNETGGGGGGGGGGPPDFGGYMSDANNFDGNVADATGSAEVTVDVGAGSGLSFGPAAVHVDNGATVIWEWTGEGGTHNVVSDGDGPLDSGSPVAESGATYEYTFEEDGIYNYYCSPHQGQGMLGSVVVGTDYPTADPNASTPVNPEHMGVPFQAHWVGISAVASILVTIMFTFYMLKYGESPNTKGGNN